MTSRNFLFCPSHRIAEFEENDSLTLLYSSLGRFLRSEGWTPAKTIEQADLLVLLPRLGDRVTVEDARWMREHCGKGAAVLVVDPHRIFMSPPAHVLPWMYVTGRDLSCSQSYSWIEELRNWLSRTESLERIAAARSTSVLQLQQAMMMAISPESAETDDGGPAWHETVEDFTRFRLIGAKTTPQLLGSEDLLDCYYGILRVSSRYARIEHDLKRANRLLSMPGARRENESLAELGEIQCARRLMDACADLIQTLRYPLPRPQQDDPKLVLLIDDRPDQIAKDIEKIRAQFMDGYELWVWKPPHDTAEAKNNELSLFELCTYSSGHGLVDEVKDKHIVNALADGDPNAPVLALKDIGRQCAFILVDLLFDRSDGTEDEVGCAAIRGLIRMIRDLPAVERGSATPHVFAFSRADDHRKIESALLAGASGYLLKDRLLSMPATLGKLRTPFAEPSDILHRNFRALYDLPRATMALLRSVTINRIDFREGYNPQIPEAQARRAGSRQAIAELLRAMPKTDLHVHVGSLMTPEFLAVASAVMLLRHNLDDPAYADIARARQLFSVFFWARPGETGILYLHPRLSVITPEVPHPLNILQGDSGVKTFDVKKFSNGVKKYLIEQVAKSEQPRNEKENSEDNRRICERYYLFRSLLHRALGIRDHLSDGEAKARLQKIPEITILQFALAHSATSRADRSKTVYDWVFRKTPEKRMPDVLRLFILHLAARQRIGFTISGVDLVAWFAASNQAADASDNDTWTKMRDRFYGEKEFSCKQMREQGWTVTKPSELICVTAPQTTAGELLTPKLDFESAPTKWLLASGTRSSSLEEYLEGCELSGAEHLQHPFLIHLYAQHVVHQFAGLGILYAELRAAAAGYASPSIEFSFADACQCLTQAFSDAQKEWNSCNFAKAAIESRTLNDGDRDNRTQGPSSTWLWGSPFALKPKARIGRSPVGFPIKLGIILTGKRHKPSREMLREAAGAVVLHTRPPDRPYPAREFVAKELEKCRFVGFDLAGKEEGNPPDRFRAEFEPLARLHIPITAHAGENAKADYIESAVLDLRARRLGHGLALPEDLQLLGRVREDGVCIELCPVSNFQTSRFVPYGSTDNEREYPLRMFMENGNAICINTDNPVISDTNIIKEYFQASYAYGGNGLSLWDALRIMRMGFVHSFMSLPERRAILEIADQILYDYFSREDVVVLLRELT